MIIYILILQSDGKTTKHNIKLHEILHQKTLLQLVRVRVSCDRNNPVST
jgi:hypothetical protein